MIPEHRRIPLIWLATAILAGPAAAQLSAPEAVGKPDTPVINYREKPRYSFTAQRLKRKPVLDGAIGPNEWDALYTVTEGPVTGTVYANWDEQFLYLAAQTNQPGWIVFNLDTADDGWLKGADNVELSVPPVGAGSSALTARLLDGRGKDTPVWDEKSLDIKPVQMVCKAAGAGQIAEMALPRGFAGFTPRPEATLGVRGDFAPAGPLAPSTPPYEPHLLLDITLVEAQVQAVEGIQSHLILEDNRVIPGQTLRGILEIVNQTPEPIRLKAISWKGDAVAADLLRTIREVNVPNAIPQKPLRLRYDSVIPANAAPGSYQVSAVAELDGGKTVSGTATFTVVEAFSLALPGDGTGVSVNSEGKLRIPVDIFSAVPGFARGELEIAVPGAWLVEGRSRKPFLASQEDRGVSEVFYVTPPPAATGEYQLHVTLSWRGRSWKATRTVKLAPAGEAKPAPAEGSRGAP